LIGSEFSCSYKDHQGPAKETRQGHAPPVTPAELLRELVELQLVISFI